MLEQTSVVSRERRRLCARYNCDVAKVFVVFVRCYKLCLEILIDLC